MPVPGEVKCALSQRHPDSGREVGRTEAGWQKAGKGKVIKERHPNIVTILLVDSDDDGLGFMDSKTLKSVEMEQNLITRCAAVGSFNPTHATLIPQRNLAFLIWIQQVLARIGVQTIIYARFSSPVVYVLSPYSLH